MFLKNFQLLIWLTIFYFDGSECATLYDKCNESMTKKEGICTTLSDCEPVLNDIDRGITNYEICPQNKTLICCPLPVSARKCREYANEVYEERPSFTPLFLGKTNKELKDLCHVKTIPLIVGGTKASPAEFPHMVLVGYETKSKPEWKCGGTLISDQFVLTAAHCINTTDNQPRIARVGELDIDNDEDSDPEDIKIIERIIHHDYHYPSKYNDIALLKLEKIVAFNTYRRPACLPQNMDSANRALVTGWGATSWHGSTSSHLLKVLIEKMDEEYCVNIYKRNVKKDVLPEGIQYSKQICAGSKTEKNDTCQGDSGGPMQIFHTSVYCMYEVIGVTSFGIQCGTPVPGVYTRVLPYVKWIEEKVWGN